jgi:hypothetical protein
MENSQTETTTETQYSMVYDEEIISFFFTLGSLKTVYFA